MLKEYTKEELWKLYEKLPGELKEAVFSEETADTIFNVCTRNGIEDDRISEIARYVGRVLLGVLPPEDFPEALEKEVKLKKDLAKKVFQEINRFIFYPVKAQLEELYRIEIAPPAKPTKITPPPEEKPPTPSEKDVYRETIE
ncbi:hypothetical protein KKA69_01500 [Patescibacteria group bacterium]|nr:hypothetical protein [Patescibacteria group bacterium]